MEQRALKQVAIRRGAALEAGEDVVVVEGPLEVRLNGEPVAVTMRTPGDDEALARGLVVGEGLIGPGCEPACTWRPCDRMSDAAVIDLAVPPEALRAAPVPRAQIASASCGICGTRSIADLAPLPLVAADGWRLPRARVPALIAAMAAAQAGFRRSGGSHAAALFDGVGGLLAAAEDVGRHNAVDKAVGLALDHGRHPGARCLAVSGRVSYEIVAKAARCGLGLIAAVSAPSSLAVEAAERCGICLLGFCRGERASVYSQPQRLIPEPAGVRG